MAAQGYYGGGSDDYNQGSGQYGNQGQYGGGYQAGQYGGGNQGGQHDNRPPAPADVPYPWRAEWEERDGRYVFVNGQTGERSNQFPGGGNAGQRQHGGGAAYDGGYGGGQYGGPSGPGGYERPGPQYHQQQGGSGYPMGPQGNSQSQQHEEETKKKSGHGWLGAAVGVAAGLAGGAFLMHEGEEAKEHFEQDKYRVEDRVDDAEYRTEERADRFGEDVENAPEDVAGWAGRRVGDMESIPDRIENKWENGVEDVEDAPERLANWGGEQVGRAERFGDDVDNYGDRVEDSYDNGRDEERYNGDNNDNNDRW